MKFLVTGGAGFIGSNIVELLVSNGHDVRVLDNFSSGKPENLFGLAGRIEVVRGDIRDEKMCARATKGVDHIIHLAAQISVLDSVLNPAETHSINIDGTTNLLHAANVNNVRSLVYASSCAVYGDNEQLPIEENAELAPLTPYATSKLAGEDYCRMDRANGGLKCVVLRLFNVYGPRQAPDSPYAAVVPKFVHNLLNHQTTTVFGDGEQTRDFTFVADVARAFVLGALNAQQFSSPAYNISAGNPTSVLSLYNSLSRRLGMTARPHFSAQRSGEIRHSHGSSDLFKRAAHSFNIDFKPRSMEAGLKPTLDWFLSQQSSNTAFVPDLNLRKTFPLPQHRMSTALSAVPYAT